MRYRLCLCSIHVALGGVVMVIGTAAHALPVLGNGQFFGAASLFSQSDWAYSGTLPASLRAGFRAENIDNFCVPFIGCTDGDKQYANGSRTMTTTIGASPSYSLSFRGEFETENQEAWEISLLDQSKGVLQTDVDRVRFVSPGTGVASEHPIPNDWQSLTGYANPAGTYAQFDKVYTLSKSYLDPGTAGCPLTVGAAGTKTGVCDFVGAYFKGGADLTATLQGYGSIENTYVGSQSVTVTAKADRITTLLVNGSSVATGTVNGSAASFSLEEERVNAVDFRFSGSFASQSISAGATVTWDGRGETSTLDASYVSPVRMAEYEFVGNVNSYTVQLRDTLSMSAGLTGTDFYKASVLASTGLSAIDSSLLPVYQAVAGGHLAVKSVGLLRNRLRPQLAVPAGGFQSGILDFMQFVLTNDGSLDLTLDGVEFALVDEDFEPFFRNDVLASVMRDYSFTIRPDELLVFTLPIDISADRLNAANDFLDGGFLELAGSGVLAYHDVNGSRTVAFDLTIPEPTTLILAALGMGMLGLRRGIRQAENP